MESFGSSPSSFHCGVNKSAAKMQSAGIPKKRLGALHGHLGAWGRPPPIISRRRLALQWFEPNLFYLNSILNRGNERACILANEWRWFVRRNLMTTLTYAAMPWITAFPDQLQTWKKVLSEAFSTENQENFSRKMESFVVEYRATSSPQTHSRIWITHLP